MQTYSLEDFALVPSVKESVRGNVNIDSLPDLDSVKTLAKWTEPQRELFNKDAAWFEGTSPETKQDRSAAMARLAYYGAEQSWDDEQIVAVLYDADTRWGKYVGRMDRDRRILEFVNRARVKIGYNPIDIDLSKFTSVGTKPTVAPKVVSPEEGAAPLIYGFMDLVAADFPINWQLEGLLPKGGLGFVTGYPGVGKTQIGIAMGAYLALGHDKWLKWNNPNGCQKVLFISLEMGPAPLRLFLDTISNSYEDKVKLNKNFRVMPQGESMPLDTKEGQAFFNNILDEEAPEIIIIDSLQAIMSKEMTDELAVKTTLAYLAATRKKYGTSIVIIHHNRKKANDGQKKAVELSDVYGSTYIAAGSDFILSFKLLTPDLLGVDMLKSRLGKTEEGFEILRDSNLAFSLEFDDIRNNFPTQGGPFDV